MNGTFFGLPSIVEDMTCVSASFVICVAETGATPESRIMSREKFIAVVLREPGSPTRMT